MMVLLPKGASYSTCKYFCLKQYWTMRGIFNIHATHKLILYVGPFPVRIQERTFTQTSYDTVEYSPESTVYSLCVIYMTKLAPIGCMRYISLLVSWFISLLTTCYRIFTIIKSIIMPSNTQFQHWQGHQTLSWQLCQALYRQWRCPMPLSRTNMPCYQVPQTRPWIPGTFQSWPRVTTYKIWHTTHQKSKTKNKKRLTNYHDSRNTPKRTIFVHPQGSPKLFWI